MLNSPTNSATKCRLKLPVLDGTSYDPPFRNVFFPDETLRVSCDDKYWIVKPQDTTVVTTCNEDGQWSIRPICQGKKLHEVCARERLWDCFSYCVCMVVNPRWWFSILSLILEVVCTNRKPYVVEAWHVRWGQRPTLGETVRYRCISGFKSTDGSNLAKCTRDGWRPDPLCKGIFEVNLVLWHCCYCFVSVSESGEEAFGPLPKSPRNEISN